MAASPKKPPMSPLPELLSVQDAGALFQVCPRTIRRWITAGMLPAHRIGRVIRLAKADVDTLLRRSRL